MVMRGMTAPSGREQDKQTLCPQIHMYLQTNQSLLSFCFYMLAEMQLGIETVYWVSH